MDCPHAANEHAQGDPGRRVLRARYVFPVAGEPIPDGEVTIRAGRIEKVGRRTRAEAVELGNVALLPGLVNAHTHLEFSGLAAPLGRPGMGFVEWIREVIRYRRQAGETSADAVRLGLQESLRHGTTTLAEIAQPGHMPTQAWAWHPLPSPLSPLPSALPPCLDATVFLELIAPTASRVPAAEELARRHLDADVGTHGWRPGLSPHAPYSVHPALLSAAVSLCRARHAPLAMHLAESREEIDWLRAGGGPFADFLGRLDGFDPSAFPPGRRPLDYLRLLAQAPRTLVIHGNYLDDEEIAFLAAHADRVAVVYCPRTHAWFGHADYPLEKMLAAGVAVALGTDGRASAPDLSVLAEMRRVASRHPAMTGRAILRLGTLAGARALGRDSETGSLEPGKLAHLVAVALPDRDAADPHDLLLGAHGPVTAVYVAGERRD